MTRTHDTHHFATHDDVALFYRRWPAQAATRRGVVVPPWLMSMAHAWPIWLSLLNPASPDPGVRQFAAFRPLCPTPGQFTLIDKVRGMFHGMPHPSVNRRRSAGFVCRRRLVNWPRRKRWMKWWSRPANRPRCPAPARLASWLRKAPPAATHCLAAEKHPRRQPVRRWRGVQPAGHPRPG